MKEASNAEVFLWKSTASVLKGSERRQFMARVVNRIGRGGQVFAEEVLGWNRGTIRKGQLEVQSGQVIDNRVHPPGRKRAEEHLPNLLQDMASILESATQSDPPFSSPGSRWPLPATELRRRLIIEFDYKDDELPCVRTLNNKLNILIPFVR